MYRIKLLVHENGERLPILICQNGHPLVEPNLFVLSRRHLGWRTLEGKLKAIALLLQWADEYGIDLAERCADFAFTEQEVNGSLIPFLRKSYRAWKVQKLAVAPKTFNNRLLFVKEYLGWSFQKTLSNLPTTDSRWESLQAKQRLVMGWLSQAFIRTSAAQYRDVRGLSNNQLAHLINRIVPDASSNPWKNQALRHRNEVVILLLLNLGLRPSELLKLKVEDVHIGAISSVSVQRRPDEREDPRRRSPEVKRRGRILPLSETALVRTIDRYICDWRPQLDDRHETGTDYLILSRHGQPLSYASLFEIFLDLRTGDSTLPDTFSPKTLRHVFSSQIQKDLRQMGLSEEKIRARLMYLRGDTSDRSQDTYLAENDREEAGQALAAHQKSLFGALNIEKKGQS